MVGLCVAQSRHVRVPALFSVLSERKTIMRDLYTIYAAIVTNVVTDLSQYRVRVLFCLPLGDNLDDVDRYLLVISAPDHYLHNSDIVYQLLNDALRKSTGRTLSAQRVGHYFEGGVEVCR